MSEAAYEKAKQAGELLEQRLTNIVEMGLPLEVDELSILTDASDIIAWYGRERDSLIDEVKKLETINGLLRWDKKALRKIIDELETVRP